MSIQPKHCRRVPMISRRAFFVALAGAPLAACNTTQLAGLPTYGEYAGWYIGTREDHPFPIPLVDRSRMRPEQRPQTVAYHGPERPGTVFVDIDQRFLYLVQGDGTMVKLKPDLQRYAAAGLGNPLGARALYLYQGNRDILFRIHGTNEPWTIGEQVSSGCIRMLSEDVVDLYNRVPVGATVLVRRNGRYRV